jgi:hypothetical protein
LGTDILFVCFRQHVHLLLQLMLNTNTSNPNHLIVPLYILSITNSSFISFTVKEWNKLSSDVLNNRKKLLRKEIRFLFQNTWHRQKRSGSHLVEEHRIYPLSNLISFLSNFFRLFNTSLLIPGIETFKL